MGIFDPILLSAQSKPPTAMMDPATFKRAISSGLPHALEEAKNGYDEGGIPIGSAIVESTTGKLLGQGRNTRVQGGGPCMHVSLSCIHSCET